ncbi:exodeoxyribonuclease 7 large subunit [Francisella halioticida]|uniref:Exodeoxyribonuclease 7 large subunit n=1 Tax=Francisella halioticida TaxID=549298 RepID=A0ABM6LYW9_9GAMM|nr:exodeoxyribonuclease VII large subunit [Francisella halioticida]ASG67673.1 exodeoxyribonuclease VII large subunit [Francisella halioticida]BCD90235.1 exodeoxyribonuclease 7 large subunit [Francisella halioticida]
MQESLKLSEFLELIKSTIEMSFSYEGFWIVAELSEWRRSGKHYYGELIEHDGVSKYPVAKIRCNCWANKANYILKKFNSSTNEELNSDMKVLLRVSVNYHISFGLSLNIIDIDPAFTLGDRQARKLEILNALAKKGILEKNKKLNLSVEFTNIAVITSITAAGKGDFFEEADKLQLLGLCSFEVFEAKMQGKDCAISVSDAFNNVMQKSSQYDAIVLIRGGGAQADLDWFNNILPAESICNSMLPVMIGIGHERDSTVLDEICTKHFDTPSKVIGFIINTVIENARKAKYNYESVIKIVKNLTKYNQTKLERIYNDFKTRVEHYLYQVDQGLEYSYKGTLSISKGLVRLYSQAVESQYANINLNSQNLVKYYSHSIDEYYKQSINISKSITRYYNQTSEYLYKQILSVSIEPTLKRGFSVTVSQDGEYITSYKQVENYSILDIVYADGQIQVEIKK